MAGRGVWGGWKLGSTRESSLVFSLPNLELSKHTVLQSVMHGFTDDWRNHAECFWHIRISIYRNDFSLSLLLLLAGWFQSLLIKLCEFPCFQVQHGDYFVPFASMFPFIWMSKLAKTLLERWFQIPGDSRLSQIRAKRESRQGRAEPNGKAELRQWWWESSTCYALRRSRSRGCGGSAAGEKAVKRISCGTSRNVRLKGFSLCWSVSHGAWSQQNEAFGL